MITQESTFPDFFILGAQRSGTTLLRLILNNHPLVAIPEEATFLMPLITKKSLLTKICPLPVQKSKFIRFLSENPQFKKWNIGVIDLENILDSQMSWIDIISQIYKTYAFCQNKVVCGDKTPSFLRKLEIILHAFPDSKFIHIARDGRDIYLSLKERKHSSAWSIATSALEWRVKLSFVKTFRRKFPERLLEIRYEDLLADPETCVKKVCYFLGLEYMATVLDFWRTSGEFIDPRHSTLIFGPIDKSNIGKWKTAMTLQEREIFLFLSKSTLLEMGYQTNYEVSLTSKFLAMWQLVVYLPMRLTRVVFISIYMKFAVTFGLKVPTAFYS